MRLQQLYIKPRIRHLNRRKAKAFGNAPHRKGVISKIAIMTPRKPNSARRTFAKVRLL
jgi:ribosomal protein S12